MKRTSLIIGGTLVVCLASLAVASKTTASRNTKPRMVTLVAPVAPQQQATPEIKTFPLAFYVANGFPVTISNAVVLSPRVASEKQDRAATAKFTIANRDGSKINSVSLTILEFQGAGKLRRVDGWIKDVGLSPGSSTEVSFELGRRVTPGDKLVLAVERVNGLTTRETNFLDLAQVVADSLNGANPAPPSIQRSDTPLPDDSGAAMCSNAFRRAMSLTQAGDRSAVTSFACDQAERSFVFTFSGKSLSK